MTWPITSKDFAGPGWSSCNAETGRTVRCESFERLRGIVVNWQTVAFPIQHFGSVTLLAVAALFPIVNPLAGAPIYLAMTASLDPKLRGAMAKAVAINSFLLLVASALVGAYVLDFFGISVPVVRVAGGRVVCAIGWSMLNNPDSPAVDSRSVAAAAGPEAV